MERNGRLDLKGRQEKDLGCCFPGLMTHGLKAVSGNLYGSSPRHDAGLRQEDTAPDTRTRSGIHTLTEVYPLLLRPDTSSASGPISGGHVSSSCSHPRPR